MNPTLIIQNIIKTILLLGMVTVFSNISVAQEIKVRNISQLTTDISARSTVRMDANNKECAIVRVNIPSLKTMDFGGAVVGEVEYNAGEYLLYVPEGTTQIPLSVSGYKKSIIDFNQYGVSVTGKNVYRVTLFIDNDQPINNEKYGRIKITTEPENSYILMDGMPIGESPLMLSDVSVGKHVISFPNTSGYSLPDQTIIINENDTIEKHCILKENTDVFAWEEEIPLVGSTNDGGMLYPVKYKRKTINGKKGIQDYWGNWVVPCEFHYVDNDTDGSLFIVGNYIYGQLHLGVYKPNVGLILPCDYTYIRLSYFQKLIMVSKGDYINGTREEWGLFDKQGKEIAPCIYKSIRCIGDKYFVTVSKQNVGNKSVDKYGMLDDEGNIIIEPDYYDYISKFSEGRASVVIGDQCYIIDEQGNRQITIESGLSPNSPSYGDGGCYTEGIICASKGYEKVGIINSLGQELVPFVYHDNVHCKDGWIKLEKSLGEWVVVDKNEHVYMGKDDVDGKGEILGRFLCLKKEGKYGLIDQNGNNILPFEYDVINQEDDYIIVYKDDTIRILDMSLNEILTIDGTESLSIEKIKDDIILLEDYESNRYGFMNLKGEILAGCLFDPKRIFNFYENSGDPYDALICNGLGLLCIGDRCGLINKDGKIVVPLIYSIIVPFFDNTIYGLKPDGTWVDLKVKE